MHRLLAAVLATAALVIGACGGSRETGADPTAENGVEGTIEGAPAPSSGDPAHSNRTGAPPASPASSGSGDSSDEAARVASASQALDEYVDALVAGDHAAAGRVSTGGAQLMARLRGVVASYNAEQGGRSTVAVPERAFRFMTGDASTVAFAGRARMVTSVRGPAADPHEESALFEAPVVAFQAGAWRVSSFSYDGRPMEHRPSTAVEKVGAVELRLAGALSFGESTGVLLDLVTDGDHGIRIENAHLRYGDVSAPSTFGALVPSESALYFLYDRRDATPTAWTALVIVDAGTPQHEQREITLRF